MESDKEVELAVRRVVGEELRRRGTSAAGSGGGSALGALGLTLMFAAFVVAFAILFNQSLEHTEERLEASLGSRLVEFRIAEHLRARVEAYLQDALDETVGGEKTRARLRALVDDQATAAVDNAAAVIESRVGERVRLSLANLPGGADLITAVQVPSGAVLAFDRQRCPDGWSPFDALAGRVIVGAGRAEGLTPRRVGDRGGEERVTLTLAQMPEHRHANPTIGPNQVIQEIEGLEIGGRGSYGPQHRRPTDTAGQSQPHENMPPFFTLLYCRKN